MSEVNNEHAPYDGPIPGWTCIELRRWYDEIADTFPSWSVFVEVGVAYGASLAHLVKGMDTYKHYKIYGVDIFEEHQGKGQISEEDWARVTAYGNPMRAAVGELRRACPSFFDVGTLIRSTGVAAADTFPDDFVDVLFLDEHHTLESVSGAIKAWLPRIKPGGIMSGHDCNPHYPGVLQAVNLLLPGAEVRPPHPDDNGWGGVWIWRKPLH